MTWEVVIGLETHAQLSTASKIFSGAPTAFGAAPNTQASAIDIALPGVLPVLNRGAVERAIRFGLAVGATINRKSVFARKNYFYPDLPKGYQISQYEIPIVQGGSIAIVSPTRDEVRIALTRAHLEEDAGKSLHERIASPGTPGHDTTVGVTGHAGVVGQEQERLQLRVEDQQGAEAVLADPRSACNRAQVGGRYRGEGRPRRVGDPGVTEHLARARQGVGTGRLREP
jgi:hypothetical protein